jgi:folate-binding Fe-S cluster repair protein YgfZ
MLPLSACSRCGLPRRELTASLARHVSTSSTRPRIAPLDRSILELSGPDAPKFLKGLSCKDVESLGGGYSGFLNASVSGRRGWYTDRLLITSQGRVLHTAFIFLPRPDTYLISHESPPDHPAPLHKLLPPFRLRSKVRIKDVSSEWTAWSAWGRDMAGPAPRRIWKFGSGGAAESHWEWDTVRDTSVASDEVACWDLRAGFGRHSMGRQMLVPRGQQRERLFESG